MIPTISPLERAYLQGRFCSRLSTLQEIAVWFDPQSRKIFTRSRPYNPATIHENRRGMVAIPITAIFVGNYSHPCSSANFLDDLADILGDLAASKPTLTV